MDHITFDSLIFDVCYTAYHIALIACDSGTHMFPPIGGKVSLQSKRKPLKNIIQGGGVSSFLDGRLKDIYIFCFNRNKYLYILWDNSIKYVYLIIYILFTNYNMYYLLLVLNIIVQIFISIGIIYSLN